MSLLEQQNFLARLYTDGQLRLAFSSDPFKIGEENSLDESEIAELSAMLTEEISFFAESLFRKRLREAEKLLPLTREAADADFERLFREFSQIYNPRTIKKHLEDAVEFCAFLQKLQKMQNSDLVPENAKNAAKYERAKLRFYGGGKRFVACVLCGDVRKTLEQKAKILKTSFKRKTKIAV